MLLVLNVLLLVLGTATAFAAIGGETWRKSQPHFFEAITVRGWVSMVCLLLTLGIGISKEIVTRNESDKQKAENEQLKGQINNQLTQINGLRLDLKEANATARETRERLIEAQLASKKTTEAIQAHLYNRLSIETSRYLTTLGQMIAEASDGWLPSNKKEFFSRKTVQLICRELNYDAEAPVRPKRPWYSWIQERSNGYRDVLGRVLGESGTQLPPNLISAVSVVERSLLLWYPSELTTLHLLDEQHRIKRPPMFCPGLETNIEASLVELAALLEQIAIGEKKYALISRMEEKNFLRGLRSVSLGANRFGPEQLGEWRAKYGSGGK